ncbi:MAG: D-aminopeptidase [uncultured Thermomicrobiales bacterium]|uniref:D-aminopeptidase n=1 Tax=uncultured Thermomicrobiales bacterium TaxID=1645740 RepID=A0A6J4UV84_9BACT|nr:MAG: D-aminopeptidase [uncultured Thermomicrobiales bacterium]
MPATSPPTRPRLRDLGIAVGTLPTGSLNAITDVPGVRVGHQTIVRGDGPLIVGDGPVRTGVTAIHPHEGSAFAAAVPAAIGVLNGAGEITGRSQVDEMGVLESPILLTNTFSVGEVHRGCVEWLSAREPGLGTHSFVIPVVAETFDGTLNDIAGQHVRRQHAVAALEGATGGPVAEGNVGGGTGMILFGFKGGIGTASRLVTVGGVTSTVGVLIQGNFGDANDLLVEGVPVGRELTADASDLDTIRRGRRAEGDTTGDGSVIVVIGTDLPLSDRQLGRLCRRGMLGLGRTGATGRNYSGDLLLAFSNHLANRVEVANRAPILTSVRLHDRELNIVFQAVIEATAEAVLNALLAADTMTGRDGITARALPADRLAEVMGRYGRLGSAG